MKPYTHKIKLIVQRIYILAILLFFAYCPEDFPYESLSEARMQLAAAKEEGVPSLEYSEAEKKILMAHELLAEEKKSEAKKEIELSIAISVKSRERNFSKKLDSSREKAVQSITQLEEKGVPELSPEEFELAKGAFQKGKEYQEKGNQLKRQEKENVEKISQNQKDTLVEYRASWLSYRQVENIANQADELLRKRKVELKMSIDQTSKDIEKARLYGATGQDLKESIQTLSLTKKQYAEKKYILAKESLGKTRIALNELLTKLEPAYAEKIVNQAKTLVDQASKKLSKEGIIKEEIAKEGIAKEEIAKEGVAKEEIAKEGVAKEEKQKKLESAQEIVSMANIFLGDKKYSDAIDNANNAIRLAEILLGIKSTVAKRKAKLLTSDRDGILEDLGNGWKLYTVRANRKPADCLWCIAAKSEVYSSGLLWNRIYYFNRKKINNPSLIYPHQTLLIPPKEGKLNTLQRPFLTGKKIEEGKKLLPASPIIKDGDTELKDTSQEQDNEENTPLNQDSQEAIKEDEDTSQEENTPSNQDSQEATKEDEDTSQEENAPSNQDSQEATKEDEDTSQEENASSNQDSQEATKEDEDTSQEESEE